MLSPQQAMIAGREHLCVAATEKITSSQTSLSDWLLSDISFLRSHASFHRDLVQTDILDGRPDNGEATRLGREHVNLIGALSHIAKETFDRVGGLNVPVHGRGKLIKRQQGTLMSSIRPVDVRRLAGVGAIAISFAAADYILPTRPR
jgi:hypothetical protein